MVKNNLKTPLRIGTRGSDLALWQAHYLQDELASKGIDSELVVVKTRGDKDLRPLKDIAGDGFFTKDLENMLLDQQIDLAIHSAKDLASMRHHDLPWKALGPRETTSDILILNKQKYEADKNLAGCTIGTSSPRRKAQLKIQFPEVEISELRGNVPTRLSKVSDGSLAGVILAKAGLSRLNLLPKESKELVFIELDWVTAPCQGILAVQGKQEALSFINEVLDDELSDVAFLEKSILAFLGGGCHMAIGTKVVLGAQPSLSFFLEENSHISSFHRKYESNSELTKKLFWDIFQATQSISDTNLKKNLVLTHSLSNHKKVYAEALSKNIHCTSLPMIEISNATNSSDIEKAIDGLSQKSGIIFTSQYAARIFMMEYFNQGNEAENLNKLDILCVGAATQNKISEFGLQPVELQWDSDAISLAGYLDKTYSDDDSFLFIGSSNSSLPFELEARKIVFDRLNVYENSKPDWLSRGFTNLGGDYIFSFASPSSVTNFLETFGRSELENSQVIAMGPSTKRELDQNNISYLKTDFSGSWSALLETISKSGVINA